MRNFYSVSVSGYHIAEAGANPITQLAFTLANGFTYVEAYLARGMDIDDFRSQLLVLLLERHGPRVHRHRQGRTADMGHRDARSLRRRTLALSASSTTSRPRADPCTHRRSASTTSGRPCRRLCAIYDNANSLHTNAYDEAFTTPTPESVRRALAIQMIINREWGLAFNENPLQGSFIVEELTDLVEEAVLAEMDRLSERGGVLGAMETGYQRGGIQDESMLHESRKHDGCLPLIGVNTFLDPAARRARAHLELGPLHRGGEAEPAEAPGGFPHRSRLRARGSARRAPDAAPSSGGNVFAVAHGRGALRDAGRDHSALFDVGGRFRRSM